MKLSAAMIIKRGECETLKRCLDSMKGHVSEIIAVVDPTPVEGDTTDELLKEHGASIHLLPWPKDYSAARNESLRYVTGDWVIIIDTDEYIKSFSFPEPGSADPTAFRVIRENEYTEEDHAMLNTERITRLFKNGLYRYEGRVHEQVVRNDGKPYMAGDANIVLGHTGYVDRAEMLRKSAEYRSLLHKMLEEGGDDPYVYFQIGRTYYVEGDYANSAKAFRQAIDAGADTKDAYVESLIETYGYCLLELKQFADAMQLTGFDEYEKSADYHFLKGLIYMNNGLFDDAIGQFETATRCPEESVKGTSSYAAWYNCGVICEVLGNKDLARSYYKKSGDYAPALNGLERL